MLGTDVLVIGGGATGAGVAWDAALRGLDVVLADRADVAAGCIEDTGGLFVTTPFDDPDYADRFAEGCRGAGVPCEEIEPAEALRQEPRLNPGISRAFRVPDGAVDIWKLVWALARGAEQRGAHVLPYHEAVAIHRDGDRVTGARLRNHRTGEEVDVDARVTVSAAGAWVG